MALVTLKKGEIKLDSVYYRYPKSENFNLKKLKLDISAGEFVAVMGPTGAGKTTFQMLLNGLIPHFFQGIFKGVVLSNGLNTTKFSIQTQARFTGFVMQDPETQIFGVTVEKDVAFGPGNLGLPRHEINVKIKKALTAVRLTGYENRSTANLSGGEKQRLAIAGILAMEPDILVLDEPTSELDPIGKREIFQTLTDLRKNSTLTIIIASHDSEEILEHVDRVIVLDDGKIAWNGHPKNLFRDVMLVKKLGVRPPEVTELGFALNQANIIKKQDIPSKLQDAKLLLDRLLKDKRDKTNPIFENKSVKQKNDRAIVHVKNLVHQYEKGIEVLKGINLEIKKGELIALLGQNGAGKTTLVRHFNGLLAPTSGAVIIDNVNTKTSTIASLAKKVGYVFQNPDHQIFCSTVEEEIEYGLKKYGVAFDERQKRVSESLEFVGLTESRKRHPFMMGKGERQKLAVATVLAMSPEIIVIDEPTTGQDWQGTQRMMKMILKLNQKGHTIIMITHNMRIAAQLAHRVIVMHQGNILMDGSPTEVFSQTEKLKKSYLYPLQTTELAIQLKRSGFPPNILDIETLASLVISKIKGSKN